MKKIVLTAAMLCASAGLAQADVITDWNETMIDQTRAQPLAGPGFIARAQAMMFLAMYNAVNSAGGGFESYGGFTPSSPVAASTSLEAAAATAAYEVLSVVLQDGRQASLDAAIAASLAAIPDGPGKDAGIALGEEAAAHMLALRSGDGSDADPSYVFGTNPGDWVLTQPGNPVHPHWGNVTPFAMTDGDQFQPQRLNNYGTMANFIASAEYVAEYNEVKDLGRIDRWTPADEEYQIAFFWANDRDGTSKPPGHLNQITQTYSDVAFAGLSDRERLREHARLFALVNMAMGDAGVGAWDAKYNTDLDLWRPVTAVQQGELDGNPETVGDPEWVPLNNVDPDGDGPLGPDPFSPNFPAWVSGHATFGAAHAGIMRAYFGSDEFEATAFFTDDPYVPGLERTFTRWSDMAWENAESRLYLGVHYRIDAVDGNALGTDIADWAFANYLRPLGCNPSDVSPSFGTLDVNDVMDFAAAYNNGEAKADLFPNGGDGELNINDILVFALGFNEACP